MKKVQKIVFFTLCVLFVVPQASAMDQQAQTGFQETPGLKFYNACKGKTLNIKDINENLFNALGKNPNHEELFAFLQAPIFSETSLLEQLVVGKDWQVLHDMLLGLSSKQLKELLKCTDIDKQCIFANIVWGHDSLDTSENRPHHADLIKLLAQNLDSEDKVKLLSTPCDDAMQTVFEWVCSQTNIRLREDTLRLYENTIRKCEDTIKVCEDTRRLREDTIKLRKDVDKNWNPFTILGWFLFDEKLEKKDLVALLKAPSKKNPSIKRSLLHVLLENSQGLSIQISKTFSDMFVELLKKLDKQDQQNLLFDLKDAYGKFCHDIIKENVESSKINEPFIQPPVEKRFCDSSFATAVYFLERLAPVIITGVASCFELCKNPLKNAIAQLCTTTIFTSSYIYCIQRHGFHDQERYQLRSNPYKILSVLSFSATALIASPHISTIAKNV